MPLILKHSKTFFGICLFILTSQFSFAQCGDLNFAQYQWTKKGDCDSVLIEITNTSTIPLSQVKSFSWDFGDGTKISGNSSVNTEYFGGADQSSLITHVYRDNGTYDIQFIVTNNKGCSDTLERKRSVVLLDTLSKIQHSISEQNVCFKTAQNMDFPLNYNWNFGMPLFDNENNENRDETPCRSYLAGAYLVSLEVYNTNCVLRNHDTIRVKGPSAIIEVPYSRIAFDEKYQCQSNKTVQFTNNSSFYQNDGSPNDEDSVILVNGERRIVFNYDDSTQTGDQTAVITSNHESNRRNRHVTRIWDFGDQYANQCTTITAINQNVGKNCNYSRDSLPAHKYLDWDTIYNNYHLGDTYTRAYFDSSLKKCIWEPIDKSYGETHRDIFYKKHHRPFLASLTLTDTVSGLISRDTIPLVIGKPDASKMTISQSSVCPIIGTNAYHPENFVEFDLNTGGQSYFAVNYDSLSSKEFHQFNDGYVNAPGVPPGNPLPFSLPYSIVGNYGTQFIKGYSPGEISYPKHRTPSGSFTIGVIVGNGPILSGKTLPQCLDTAWYHDAFRVNAPNVEFEILDENGDPYNGNPHFCQGEEICFKVNNKINDPIIVFGIRYSSGSNTSFEANYFHYLQKYNGPTKGRNDSSINYQGQNWRYNYVVRNRVDHGNQQPIDTIVTAIVKDWHESVELNKGEVKNLLTKNADVFSFSQVDLLNMLGTALDTSGISDQISIKRTEYRWLANNPTFVRSGRRYRYTNSNHSDSIEVAQILHFRDSSIQGYDTLVTPNGIVPGVWKRKYTHEDNGRSVNSSDHFFPNFSIINEAGCGDFQYLDFSIGHYSEFKVSQPNCSKSIEIQDSIRYLNVDRTHIHDTTDYWNIPKRFNKEQFKIDWDISDGIGPNWEKGPGLKHTYPDFGQYTAVIAMKDSLGCTDTAYVPINLSQISPDFEVEDSSDACTYQYFLNNKSTTVGDSIIKTTWLINDSVSLTGDKQGYLFKEPGNHKVKLTAHSLSGCTNSITKNINVKDGSIMAPPRFSYDLKKLTLRTASIEKDSGFLHLWDWDDNSSNDTGQIANHLYQQGGNRNVCLKYIDLSSNCFSDSCKTINVGGCDAYFVIDEDTAAAFTIQINDSSTGSNLNYLWHWGDGDSSNIKQPTHLYSSFGKYLVTLRVSNTNCVSYHNDSLGMDSLGNILKVDGFTVVVGELTAVNEEDAGSFLLYPNPTDGHLIISVSKGNIQKVEIISPDGKLNEFETTLKQPKLWNIEIDKPSGVYTIRITTDEGIGFNKVILTD